LAAQTLIYRTMKNPILIILALLLGLLPAQAQFQSVTTTANGTLHSPTNLWAQNSIAIAQAMISGNGIVTHTGNGTLITRTITGTAGQIDVTNGNGTSGNPTLSLPTTITGNRTIDGNVQLGTASGQTLTILPQTITASNANGTGSNSIANVGTLTTEMIFRPWVRHIITEIHNFETAMLTAVGGTSGNFSLTGGVDRPAWAYRPSSTTDGAENWQSLIGPFKTGSIGTRTIKNWSKRTALTIYSKIAATSSNTGTTRYLLGPNSGTYAGGTLAVKGIGFIITNKVIFAVAHNGTTLTTAGSGVTLADNTNYVAHIESDGAGGVRWWINGVEQTAITGGPTGNSASSEYGFVTSALNATPATNQFVFIHALRIISEL
jgi:hypothetical protein